MCEATITTWGMRHPILDTMRLIFYSAYYRCQSTVSNYTSSRLCRALPNFENFLIARPAPGARLARRIYRNYDRQLTEVFGSKATRIPSTKTYVPRKSITPSDVTARREHIRAT